MKLNFNRRGVKLFFFTIAVKGRKGLLSKLLGETERPALASPGAVVKALWRSVHGLYPSLGTSDYVIMPDHVHLLLVVDYDRDPCFNPLVFVHWFMEQSARWIDIVSSGMAPVPDCDARKMAPLPEFLFAPMQFAYPERGSLPDQTARGCGGVAPDVRFSWEGGFWLDLPMGPRHLAAIRHYIRLNPARAIWKRNHPDLFVCHRAIKAKRLEAFAPTRFDGIGNLPLLGSPFLFHVRLTLKKTVAEHKEAIDEIVDKARQGMVPVSGFISPGEREALRRLKAEPRARFVKLLPFALPQRYDPSAEDSREIASGRLVILSAFPDTPVISSLDMRRSQVASRAFRANCLAMNDFAAWLCEI